MTCALLWASLEGSLTLLFLPLVGFLPIPPQPIGQHGNRLRIQYFVVAEFRHAIVALAIITLMCRVSDQPNQPFAGTVAGQIRTGGVFVFAMKLVAFGAAHVGAGQQVCSLGND